MLLMYFFSRIAAAVLQEALIIFKGAPNALEEYDGLTLLILQCFIDYVVLTIDQNASFFVA